MRRLSGFRNVTVGTTQYKWSMRGTGDQHHMLIFRLPDYRMWKVPSITIPIDVGSKGAKWFGKHDNGSYGPAHALWVVTNCILNQK